MCSTGAKSRCSSYFSIAENESVFLRLLNYILFDFESFCLFLSTYLKILYTFDASCVYTAKFHLIQHPLRTRTARPQTQFLVTPNFLAFFHPSIHSHIPEPTLIYFAILYVLQNDPLVCYEMFLLSVLFTSISTCK